MHTQVRANAIFHTIMEYRKDVVSAITRAASDAYSEGASRCYIYMGERGAVLLELASSEGSKWKALAWQGAVAFLPCERPAERLPVLLMIEKNMPRKQVDVDVAAKLCSCPLLAGGVFDAWREERKHNGEGT